MHVCVSWNVLSYLKLAFILHVKCRENKDPEFPDDWGDFSSSHRIISDGHWKNLGLANPLMKGIKFVQHILIYYYENSLIPNYTSTRGKEDDYNKSPYLV